MTKELLRLGIKLRGSLWPEIVRVEKVGKLGESISALWESSQASITPNSSMNLT